MMQIKFHGTRGSVPTPGIETVKYGGNTSCVEFSSDENVRIILDAGTGIRKINNIKFDEKIRIFFSHSHWDHLQGLPFFHLIYNPESSIDFLINSTFFDTIKSDLLKQMSGKSFPIKFENLPCEMNFIKIDKKYQIDKNLSIELFENIHPGGSTAIKIINGNKVFTFITDNELQIMKEKGIYDDMVDFCKDSSIIVHDGQYLNSEMRVKKGWGHSSIEDILDLFIDCKVKIGLFTHHDPERSDDEIDQFEKWGKEQLLEKNINMIFLGAKENDVIEI